MISPPGSARSPVKDDGSPASVELQPGDFPRIVFRPAPNHQYKEVWQDRPVRRPPVVPGQPQVGPMAYYNNSKSLANSNVLQIILRDHGYDRVEDKHADWSIFWCAGQVEPADLEFFFPHQRVNKFPRASALTLKSNLWSCFARMLQKYGAEHFSFMPQTFILPGQLTLYGEFMDKRAQEGAEKDVWILKPAAAYCGRGIFLHRPGDVPTGEPLLTESIKEHRGVACRYIDPPFLIDGLKSDIRLYVLCTSIHPLTVYLFEEGLGRFATEKYTIDDIDQRCMHLTNYSLNKHSSNFVKNTNEDNDDSGSKWSLSAFKRRLEKEVGAERSAEIWRQVDDLVVKTLISAEPTLFESLKAHLPAAARGEPNRTCFQVFGFDVMLDEQGKPWLLECNLDPALRTESPLDLKIKSTMLVDLLNVVGMPMPPAPETRPDAAAAGAGAVGAAAAACSTAGAAAVAPDISDDAPAGGGSGALDVSDAPAEPELTAAMAAAAWKARRDADKAKLAELAAASGEAGPSSGPAGAVAVGAAIATTDGSAGGGTARERSELSDLEQWHLHLINAELARSKQGRWRRLLPGAKSAYYCQFLDESRTHNRLPFDI